MNERLTKIKSDSTNFWSSRTKKQKGAMFGALVAIIVFASVLTYFSTRTEMVPMYTNLSQSEVGKIKDVLDAQGVTYEIAAGGTNILVPAKQADSLKVSLANQGFPQSGGISTSFFAENAGFGMTENEFDVLKLAATQTEIANLLKQFDGVNNAVVQISMPKQGVFLQDGLGEAKAAVMLETAPGQQFTDAQIKTLYSLVEKSIPNLTTDNIQITNQYAEHYDLDAAVSGAGSVATVDGQMQIKKTIERDLQRQVQNMLGTLMGQDKVLVSVTTDIDFKQENRQENLVLPVDEENMSGIAISAQRITETYTGSGATATGTPEAGQVTDNFTDYVEGAVGDGEYERMEETINNDVNRIRKEIHESPYKIRDIGIQVMVEPPNPEDLSSLSEEARADIEQFLTSIVRTTLDKEAAGDLTNEAIANKIVVSVQPFFGKDVAADTEATAIPWWIWVIGGVLLVAILLLVFFILRSRKRREEEELSAIGEQQEKIIVEDIAEEKETEATVRRKQLEKMAKDKPDDFAKLLRSWIAED
ncbi:flagellar basal-body MS-ring/collar protein FliF [Metasolibacillus sp. FSL H7-0170]|uniref:flagellar basal-body MS-ring/collar protein FliF n=1 Tax=Metasolibacillus sp. FSL H7-0170 TaxID=2921431 RepID=UPI003158435F